MPPSPKFLTLSSDQSLAGSATGKCLNDKTICTVMSSERIEDWIQCITRGHRAHEECTDIGTRNLSLNVPTANLTYGRQNENISCCLVKFNF